ncbi:MAG: hypothetical protein V4550_04370 [Gemmatimonadota bacterium]
MELSQKTTILFPPEMHRSLTELAARRGVSLGVLVREACIAMYAVDQDARLSAVTSLAELQLPVGTPATMKRESVPDADALMP